MPALKLETNIPAVIALAFSEGKEVESQYTGTQVMYSLVDGRQLYLPPFVADKIRAAGVTARQPFEICRKQVGKSTEYQIKTHNAAVGGVSKALPTTAQVQSDNGTNREYNNAAHHRDRGMTAALDATYSAMAAPKRELSAMASRILAAYVVAFEVAAALETVVDERGLALNFTKEDFIIRTAATAFIEANKAAR